MTSRAKLPALGVAVACVALLGGCATLPSSGPTAHDIQKRADAERAQSGYRIVLLSEDALAKLSTQPPVAATFAALGMAGRHDALGPGDVLDISLFEVGVSLFAASSSSNDKDAMPDPSAHAAKFPPLTVDSAGMIRLPYLGSVRVDGLTPDELEGKLESALRSKSQSPQAIVTVSKSQANSVYILGEVRKPGRYELGPGNGRLLALLAEAEGSGVAPEDLLITITRNGRSISERLADIQMSSADDIEMVPGDQLQLAKRPRTFTVFGATGKVSQLPFDANVVSLAEALARAGGPNDIQADPRAVFLFRESQDAAQSSTGQPGERIIYRIDMMDPASYFIAQEFAMRDHDLLYIANARSNQATKFISIINQLFTPFVTARTVTH